MLRSQWLAWWIAALLTHSLLQVLSCSLVYSPVHAEQLEVTLADESVFVCSESVYGLAAFGSMATFGEHYLCTLTCRVAERLHQDVILGMDWMQCEDPLIS